MPSPKWWHLQVSGKTVSSGTICLDCCLMQLSLREQDRMMLSRQLPMPKWTLWLTAELPHPRIVPERSNPILSLLQKKLGPYFVTSELTGRSCVQDGAVVSRTQIYFTQMCMVDMDEKPPGVYILPKLFSDKMLPMLVTFLWQLSKFIHLKGPI